MSARWKILVNRMGMRARLSNVWHTARPLRVEELAEFLAFDFERINTTFLADGGQKSSARCVIHMFQLLAVVNVDGSSVIHSHILGEGVPDIRALASGDTASPVSRFHDASSHDRRASLLEHLATPG